MSKINDLIKELCPNGVEYYLLSDLEDNKKIRLGRGNIISKYDIRNNPGDYPVYSSSAIGNGEIGKYGKYMFEDVRISWSIDGGGRFFYRNASKYSITNVSGWLKVLDNTFIDIKYLYYSLTNEWASKVYDYTHKAHPSVIRKEYRIPIPPIEVQKEIVRILDKFGELESELESELEARKSQYKFWREKIINMYENKNIKLSDMAKIYDGTHSTPNYQLSGIPFISVENISNIYGSNKYISEKDFQKYKVKPQINDVFMTRIGSIGRCSVFDNQVDLAYYVSLALIRPNTEIILPKYLKYVIESNIGKVELYKRTLVHAVPIKINKDEIGKIVLPVPSIDAQKKIISRLDKFESFTESISIGLPAEIELRRKQYEYYRNKILNFKEM